MMFVFDVVVAVALMMLLYVLLSLNGRLRFIEAELSALRGEVRRLRDVVEGHERRE